MREKYYWLVGGWKLALERCKRKILLGWRLPELPNRVENSQPHDGPTESKTETKKKRR